MYYSISKVTQFILSCSSIILIKNHNCIHFRAFSNATSGVRWWKQSMSAKYVCEIFLHFETRYSCRKCVISESAFAFCAIKSIRVISLFIASSHESNTILWYGVIQKKLYKGHFRIMWTAWSKNNFCNGILGQRTISVQIFKIFGCHQNHGY